MATRYVTYTVYITRTPDGYSAVCPTFPHLTATTRGARSAYTKLKALIEADLRSQLRNFKPIPHDPVVQAKTLRLDIWYLSKEESLG